MKAIGILMEGLVRHLVWWGGALFNPRDPRAPFGFRRALVLVFAMPVFIGVQSIHAVCLLLDELLFPGYRRVQVGRALFITGIPRSGTSFLQRTLAIDTDRYTSLTTWEALFAPSITQRKIVRGLAAIDRRLGKPAARALEGLTRRFAGALDDVHEVGLGTPEEDYLVLMPAGGCFIMLLAFPGATDLQALGHFDRGMPAARKRRLLWLYRRCLQRHLYAHGGQRCLLSKNAAFGSWLQGLHERFPQARFVVCIREPAAALSSQISSIDAARHLFGAAVGSATFQQLFSDTLTGTLDHLAVTLSHWPAGRVAVVDMDDLRAAPNTVIRGALMRLGEEPGSALARHLGELPAHTASRHRHHAGNLAIDHEQFERRTQSSYRHLLESPHRVRRAS